MLSHYLEAKDSKGNRFCFILRDTPSDYMPLIVSRYGKMNNIDSFSYDEVKDDPPPEIDKMSIIEADDLLDFRNIVSSIKNDISCNFWINGLKMQYESGGNFFYNKRVFGKREKDLIILELDIFSPATRYRLLKKLLPCFIGESPLKLQIHPPDGLIYDSVETLHNYIFDSLYKGGKVTSEDDRKIWELTLPFTSNEKLIDSIVQRNTSDSDIL